MSFGDDTLDPSNFPERLDEKFVLRWSSDYASSPWKLTAPRGARFYFVDWNVALRHLNWLIKESSTRSVS